MNTSKSRVDAEREAGNNVVDNFSRLYLLVSTRGLVNVGLARRYLCINVEDAYAKDERTNEPASLYAVMY